MKQRSLISMLSLSCREASKLASDGLDQELPTRDRIALRLHVLMCGGCRRFLAHLRAMRMILSQAPQSWRGQWRDQRQSLSPERRRLIEQLLAQARQADPPS